MAMTLRHAEVEELLGAYALDACEAEETSAVEAHLEVCADCAAEAARLTDAAGWLGASDASAPPTRLRAPLMQLAFSRPRGEERPRPVATYASQVVALEALLDDLAPAEWRVLVPAVAPGWSVQDVVAHLASTEQVLAVQLGALDDPMPMLAGLSVDDRTLRTVEHHRSLPYEATAAAWRTAADAVVRHLASIGTDDLRDDVVVWDLPMPLRRVLISRSFELWIHGDDIRGVLGRPLEPPADDALGALSESAVRSVPVAMRLTGRERPGRTAWVVLTGAGAGGRWPLALGAGEQPGEPDVVISADAVDFCRLAGARLTPAELTFRVEGDPVLAAEVLAAASAFARL